MPWARPPSALLSLSQVSTFSGPAGDSRQHLHKWKMAYSPVTSVYTLKQMLHICKSPCLC